MQVKGKKVLLRQLEVSVDKKSVFNKDLHLKLSPYTHANIAIGAVVPWHLWRMASLAFVRANHHVGI